MVVGGGGCGGWVEGWGWRVGGGVEVRVGGGGRSFDQEDQTDEHQGGPEDHVQRNSENDVLAGESRPCISKMR